jgi:hypothetical protein
VALVQAAAVALVQAAAVALVQAAAVALVQAAAVALVQGLALVQAAAVALVQGLGDQDQFPIHCYQIFARLQKTRRLHIRLKRQLARLDLRLG